MLQHLADTMLECAASFVALASTLKKTLLSHVRCVCDDVFEGDVSEDVAPIHHKTRNSNFDASKLARTLQATRPLNCLKPDGPQGPMS